MRKVAVLVVLGLLATPAMADYSFSAFDIGTVGSMVVTPLDVSGVPAGQYGSWRLEVDWNNSQGYAYSSEAMAGLYDVNASTYLTGMGYADNGASSTSDITLIWTGDFTQDYSGGDPLHLNAQQYYTTATGDWDNVNLTLYEAIPPNPVIYGFDMETNPGWAMDTPATAPGWAYGVPQGNDGDPTAGATGDNVIGYNLDGDYHADMAATEYCTTDPLDFSDYTDVSLEFERWLGVESSSYDHAMIEVSNDGGVTWHEIWHNGGTMNETAWGLEEYDISTYADGQSDVRVRWGMGGSDDSVQYHGWNIDDVNFRGIPEPGTLALMAMGGLTLLRRRR